MMEMLLQRTQKNEHGTFGFLCNPQGAQPFCYTLELPVPIIKPGRYKCVLHNGKRFKNVWEITRVKGHSAVLFHQGNTKKDTRGCVLVGEGITGSPPSALVNSLKALDEMRLYLPDVFMLEVKDPAAASQNRSLWQRVCEFFQRGGRPAPWLAPQPA